MKNQEKENDYYKAIGQYLIDCLDYNAIIKWDRVAFTVKLRDGFTETRTEYFSSGDSKTIVIPYRDSRIEIYDTIEELQEYTDANNYTTWNKFVFNLTSDHKFEIEYSWDQNFHDGLD